MKKKVGGSQSQSGSSTLLPPLDSEVCDAELPNQEQEIPSQNSHVQPERSLEPGPSMFNQMQLGKPHKQGAKILESGKKFVSLASLQDQSWKK